MKLVLLIVFVTFVLSQEVPDITPQDTLKILMADKNSFLIDIRTDAEWMWVGKPEIPTTPWKSEPIFVQFLYHPNRNLNPNFFEEVLSKLKKSPRFKPDSKLFFLCCCASRSVKASKMFKEKGYNAYNILYGFDGPANQDRQRGKVDGWRFRNLPWYQRT
eukprot:gene11299-4110_t